jgi:hypothetical protein
MESFLYFVHDWILDTARVSQIESIDSELVAAGDRLGVRLVTLSGQTPEGYTHKRFLIGTSSETAFNEFKAVAARWDFTEWTLIPEQEDIARALRSPIYEAIAPLRTFDSVLPSLVGSRIDGYFTKALNNEYLAKKRYDPAADSTS